MVSAVFIAELSRTIGILSTYVSASLVLSAAFKDSYNHLLIWSPVIFSSRPKYTLWRDQVTQMAKELFVKLETN